MANYHFVYKDVEGASTQWDDIQRKLGNLPPKPPAFKPQSFKLAEDEDSKHKDKARHCECDYHRRLRLSNVMHSLCPTVWSKHRRWLLMSMICLNPLASRGIVGLHQITSIGSTDITNTWEPLEEGLLPYQSPLPTNQVKTSTEFDYEGEGSPTGHGRGRGGRGRGRSRVAYGNGFAAHEYENGGWDRNRGYVRSRGRGRGRNFRGRGRGGYNGPQIDNQQDAGHYNQEGPAPGRGRGHGRGYRGRGRGFRSNGLIHAVVAVGGA